MDVGWTRYLCCDYVGFYKNIGYVINLSLYGRSIHMNINN